VTVPLHSTQFVSTPLSGAGPGTLYTVPAGNRAVVKAVNLASNASTGKFFSLNVDGAVLLFSLTLGALATFQWNGWVVLNAGETLKWSGASGGSYHINIGGYLYPLTI
jgi:hypothetical protein